VRFAEAHLKAPGEEVVEQHLGRGQVGGAERADLHG
jgi:hypothetical protein